MVRLTVRLEKAAARNQFMATLVSIRTFRGFGFRAKRV